MYDASRNTTEAMLTRMTWRSRIAQALEQDGLALHFQGIYHTCDGNLSHLEAMVRMLDPLQPGCLICLDDFGSGFSTFAYLKYLGAQILKIDGMFIRDLPNNRDNQAFVKAISTSPVGSARSPWPSSSRTPTP